MDLIDVEQQIKPSGKEETTSDFDVDVLEKMFSICSKDTLRSCDVLNFNGILVEQLRKIFAKTKDLGEKREANLRIQLMSRENIRDIKEEIVEVKRETYCWCMDAMERKPGEACDMEMKNLISLTSLFAEIYEKRTLLLSKRRKEASNDDEGLDSTELTDNPARNVCLVLGTESFIGNAVKVNLGEINETNLAGELHKAQMWKENELQKLNEESRFKMQMLKEWDHKILELKKRVEGKTETLEGRRKEMIDLMSHCVLEENLELANLEKEVRVESINLAYVSKMLDERVTLSNAMKVLEDVRTGVTDVSKILA